MFRSFTAATVFSGALMIGVFLGATSHAAPMCEDGISGMSIPSVQEAKEAPPPPDDPNKKKAGEACKSSSECQKHHTCTQVGDQSVCQPPPRHRLPPGAVT